ncbi:MAG: arginase, partial [Spirochaetae bacterium HGW-Spirochaetae-9]
MTSVFTMVVPQWQGAAAGTGPYHGAQAIARMLGADRIDVQVPVHEQSVAKKEEGIWYEYEIAEHLKSALASLEASKPQRILTIGGDCASDIASISYLNRLYDGDLTVLWLDAHADLNTPESSPSNKFHGMPLRLLLGEGAPGLLEMLPSTLEPGQVVFTGL